MQTHVWTKKIREYFINHLIINKCHFNKTDFLAFSVWIIWKNCNNFKKQASVLLVKNTGSIRNCSDFKSQAGTAKTQNTKVF